MTKQTIDELIAELDPGMLHNLNQEFDTSDPAVLITELYGTRADLLQESADQRSIIEQMIDLWDNYEMTVALPFSLRYMAEQQAAGLIDENTKLRAELERARLDLAAVRNDLDQVREGTEFLGEAAGRNAAERDHARAWAAAWKRAAKHFRFLFYNVKEELQITGEITARFRVERDEWQQAAEEAQEAQTSGPHERDMAVLLDLVAGHFCNCPDQAEHVNLEEHAAGCQYRVIVLGALEGPWVPSGPRAADVAALVEAAEALQTSLDDNGYELSQLIHEFPREPVVNLIEKVCDHEWSALDAALRPFARVVRVPVRGELSSETTLEEWVTFADPRAMTAERRDAAWPGGMEGE